MKQNSITQALSAIVGVAMTGLLANPVFAQGSISSPERQILKYGVAGASAADLNIYVGLQLGYFAKHGLDLQTQTVSSGSATDLLNLVAAGIVQIVNALPDPVVAAGAHTANFKILNETHPGPERLISRVDLKTMDQVKALETIKVAVSSPTTSIAGLSRFMLEQNGVPASKIQFIVVGGSAERLAALKNGTIDVALLIQPSDFVAIAAGLNALADSTQPQYAPYYGTTEISSAPTIAKDCDIIRHYYAAVREIAAFTKDPANEAQVVGILAQATKTTTAVAQATIDLYRADDIFPGINDPTATVIGTAKLTAALGTKVSADPSSLIDTSCVK